MLGRKQVTSNSAFIRAMARAPAIISRARLDTLVNRTLHEIAQVTRGKCAAFSWSGGKDSQVLRVICDRADIGDCVLVMTRLEYPAFLRWVMGHKPQGLTIINTGQDLPWLAAHPAYLFPSDSRIAARWFRIVQHAGQERYAREHGVDILLTGRRVLDGNYVGGADGVYTARSVTRYSPLRDWTHEEVFAFLRYHDLPLPPCYSWPNGFIEGTHSWPCRTRCPSIAQGWREVYAIDPSIVHEAAAYLPSAAAFLGGLDL